MVQIMQYNLSVASSGTSEISTAPQVISNRRLLERSDTLEVKKLEAELNEHRYYLERKIEQRTDQLVKRIKLLELCNSSLCDKLAQAKKEIAALHKQLGSDLPGTEFKDCSGLLTGYGKGKRIQVESDARIDGLTV